MSRNKNRRHRPFQAGPKLPIEVIRQLVELRSSNASGKHGKSRKATRSSDRREAIRRDLS